MKKTIVAAVAIFAIAGMQACSEVKQEAEEPIVQESAVKQSIETVFYPTIDDEWIGLGIAYGSYRDGESPDKKSVSSQEDILEDLTILSSGGEIKWNLIRMYAADAASEQVLKTIRKHKLPVKVMQGAWLSGKDPDEINNNQIDELIRLANEYDDIIVAVNLGNEIFVDWSYHKFTVEQIPMYLEWVNKVKSAVKAPVTLADDYNFYNKPWSQQVTKELDFIVLHAYAMWNSQTLEDAVSWTSAVHADIQSKHPTKQIVLGESGWATSSIKTNGDESLIVAEASEQAQAEFFKEYRAWLQENKISSFYFEAFDEKWKGGEDKPDGIAEKNWGLYRSDRTAKTAVR